MGLHLDSRCTCGNAPRRRQCQTGARKLKVLFPLEVFSEVQVSINYLEVKMETQYNSQTFSASDLSGEMQQVPSVDTDEYNSPPQKGLNLRPLLRTIQRKALLITGITSVLAVIAVLLSARSPSTYQGNFRLLVEPVTSEAKSTEP